MDTKGLKFLIAQFKAVVRETKNSPQWTSVFYLIRIFFDVRRLIKLLDPLTWRVVISYTLNQPGLSLLTKIRLVLTGTIKTTIFFVVAVLIYRINNRNLVERKSFLVGLFPTPRNFVVRPNDTVFEKAVVSSHIHSFVLSILTPPKANAAIPPQKIRKGETKEGATEEGETKEGETEEGATEEGETEEGATEEGETEEGATEEGETKEGETEEDKPIKSLLSRMQEYAIKQDERFSFSAPDRSDLDVSSNPTNSYKIDEKLLEHLSVVKQSATIDEKLLEHLSVVKQSETIDMGKLVQYLLYLRKTVSIHAIDDDEGFFKMVGDFLKKFKLFKEFSDRRDKEKSLNKGFDLKRIASFPNMPLKAQGDLIEELYRTNPIQTPNWMDMMIFTFLRVVKKPPKPWPVNRLRNYEKSVDSRFFWDVAEDMEYESKLNKMRSENFRFILSFIVKVLRFFFFPTTRVGKKFEDRITRLELFFDKYNFKRGIRALRRFLVDHNFQDQVHLLDCELTVLDRRLAQLESFVMTVLHFGKYNPKHDRRNMKLASLALAHLPAEFRERYKESNRYTPPLTFFIHENFVCKDKKKDKKNVNSFFSWLDGFCTWFQKHFSFIYTFQDFKFSFNSRRFFCLSLNAEIVSKPFLLDDDEPCQPLADWLVDPPVNSGGDSIPPDRRSREKEALEEVEKQRQALREASAKGHSDFSMLFEDPYNWVNPLTPFHRSSLLSCFYISTQGPFKLSNSDYFAYLCKKKFPFYVKKARLNDSDFLYRQFLNTLFIRNKKFSLGVGQKTSAFSERDLLSTIQSEISKIFSSKDFVQTATSKPGLYTNPGIDLCQNPIIEVSGFEDDNDDGADLKSDLLIPLEKQWAREKEAKELEQDIEDLEQDIEDLAKTGGQPLSDINLADSEWKNLHQSLSDMNLFDLEGTKVDPSLSDINLFDLEGTKADESFSDIDRADLEVDELFSDRDVVDFKDLDLADFKDLDLADFKDLDLADFKDLDLDALKDLDRDDLEDMNFDEFLSDINQADLEGANADESLSDINQVDLEGATVDASLSDINRADLKDINRADLKDINRADLKGTKVDTSLSDINRADLKGIKVDASLSDINRADLKDINRADLKDINRADLKGTNLNVSLFGISLVDLEFDDKLFELSRLYESVNSKSFLFPTNILNPKNPFIPYSSFDKFVSLELEKRKNDCPSRNEDEIIRKEQLRSLYLRICYKKMRLDRTKRLDRAFSIRSAFDIRAKGNLFEKYLAKTKWKLFKRYLPWALTTPGFRYLSVLFLDIVSDLWRRIWDRRRWRIRIIEIELYLLRLRGKWRRKWTRKWKRKLQRVWERHWTKKWLPKWTKEKKKWTPKVKKWATQLKKVLIKVDGKFFRLTFLFKIIKPLFEKWIEEFERAPFYREKTDRSPDRNRSNLQEFFLLMDLLFLFIVCIVSTSQFQILIELFLIAIKFKTAQALIIDEALIEIELEELMAEYPPSQSPDFGLRIKNFLLGLLEKMVVSNPYGLRVKKKRKFFHINLRPIIKLINLISNEITFAIKTSCLSHTSKEIYSFIRKRKKVKPYWNQTADWVLTHSWVDNQEREVLMQFINLKRTRSIPELLWSLTDIDEHLVKDEVLPEMIEQPGEVYLRKVIDFHKKDLLNYQFNPSSLVERRIFLALYHTMTYSQTSSGVDDPALSRQKPFSLRLTLAPSKSILVIGCIGLGRSYLVNYLAKNSYLPFITIFLHKFQGTIYRFEDILDEEDEYDSDDEIEILIESRDEIGMLSEDIKSSDQTSWFDYYYWRDVLVNCFHLCARALNPFYFYEYDPDPYLEEVSMDDQTDDMDTVLYVHKFYMSLQLELAKAMSPCLIWIPNIHELDFSDSDFFSIGLVAHLLSWDCERSSSSNNLVIASTHMPQKMQPSLIDTHRFNTCIKVRRPVISQQQKHFCTLSYTRGFHLEREIFETPHEFESLTLGSNAQDLAALTEEALSISLSQGKFIIDSNTIRHAVHRQNWDLRAEVRPINNSRILFYQIGRAIAHYLLLRDCPIDPISIYMNKRFCPERDPYLYRCYYQLGLSLKKLTILIYVLNCSSGLVAQDLWSRSELNANDGIALGSFVENNSDLVHGLLEVEGVLEGFLPTEKDCSQFDKDRGPVLRRPEPRTPSDMIHNGFWSMIDQSLIYQKDPLAPPIVIGGIKIDLQKMFADFVVWSPRKWSPWGFLLNWIERMNANELGFPNWSREFFKKQIEAILFNYDEHSFDENDQENDSHSGEDEGAENRDPVEEMAKKKERPTFYKLEDEDQDGYGPNFNPLDYDYDDDVGEAFLQSVYQTRARIRSCQEQIFFRISRFIWDPGNPLLMLSDDPALAAMFSPRELFPEEKTNEEKWFFTAEIKSLKKNWFLAEKQDKYGDSLFQRYRWLRRPNNSLSKGSFRSTALSESYQYLSKMFLSNRTVVNQMKNLLVRKRWLFPDDMQNFFTEQYSPAETRNS